MQAQITAAIGEKGGGAKSTTIQNLAVQLKLLGNDVLVGDVDPQCTTAKWAQRRRSERMPLVIEVDMVSARNLQKWLERNASKYDHILLDTGGADSDGMRLALMFSDIVICPCEPSQADVETLEHVNLLVGRAKAENPRMVAYVFATKAPTNIHSSDAKDMAEFCKNFEHLTLLDTVIGYRKAFKNALRDGLGVVEYPITHTTRLAISEAHQLEKEIYR